jgi:uncharacterized protein
MKIAISGSTGFIGKQLSDYLLRSGNELIVISRTDFTEAGNRLAKLINSADVIINLAGSSVVCRWNEQNRRQILESRVDTTRSLVDAVLKNLPEYCPKIFINASAIGIYDYSVSHVERSESLSSGFLASVCKAWEYETEPLEKVNLRLCKIRIGMVLGRGGGSFGKMLPIFKAGIGGKISTGQQTFSFIHILDFCRAIVHLIEHESCSGIYNLCSPAPTTNAIFTKTLSDMLHRPAFFSVPGFILKLIYGEAAELLTKGVGAMPARLLEEGFEFSYPDISTALEELVQKR